MMLTQASTQWASRPADERYTSLNEMLDFFRNQKANSRARVVPNRKLRVLPMEDHKGLKLQGPDGGVAIPTHWAFGQLCGRADSPASFLRTLPAEIVADCINWKLFQRDVEELGVLVRRQGYEDSSVSNITMDCVTGPNYGRIWNVDITEDVINRFGDGTGKDGSDWKVPGEFGQDVEITKANTTLFAGDSDMFIFLCDEKNRIEVPDRRDGKSGQMARGFFISNSEVGKATLMCSTFLFDFVCCNRIVWGARQYKEIKIRHTSGAPHRWVEELIPALKTYRNDRTANILKAIEQAKAARIEDPTDFLSKRFGKRLPVLLQDVSMDEEGHPIETLWDAATAVTAYARSRPNQDDRVDLERKAGDILDLAA